MPLCCGHKSTIERFMDVVATSMSEKPRFLFFLTKGICKNLIILCFAYSDSFCSSELMYWILFVSLQSQQMNGTLQAEPSSALVRLAILLSLSGCGMSMLSVQNLRDTNCTSKMKTGHASSTT